MRVLPLLVRLGTWAEWSIVPMLGLTTVFSLLHGQPITAVLVAAACGLVLGLKLATLLFEARLEREVQHELDSIFESYR